MFIGRKSSSVLQERAGPPMNGETQLRGQSSAIKNDDVDDDDDEYHEPHHYAPPHVWDTDQQFTACIVLSLVNLYHQVTGNDPAFASIDMNAVFGANRGRVGGASSPTASTAARSMQFTASMRNAIKLATTLQNAPPVKAVSSDMHAYEVR